MADSKPYINQRLTYTNDGRLLDEDGNAVMMDWESPIMEKSAEIVCRNGGKILNVGFGMGLVDSFIEKYDIDEHWIIEPHIDVYTKMFEDGWHLNPRVRIMYGDWQWYIKYMPKFDGIYIDTWREEIHGFQEYAPNILKDDGVLSFFNNPRNDEEGLHMMKRDYEIVTEWGEVTYETLELPHVDEVDRQTNKGLYYWHPEWKKYYCPIVKKKNTKSMAALNETYFPDKEMVNHPNHYGGEQNPYEVIKVCEAWDLDQDAYLFNVVKYVARAGKKDKQKEIEDLKKAAFYLERKIKNLEK